MSSAAYTRFRPGADTRGRGRISEGQSQLGGDYALIWRDGARVVPYSEATESEISSGIASIEKLACYIVDSHSRAKRWSLSYESRQLAITHLIGLAWIEAKKAEDEGFDPALGRIGGRVSTRLKWRISDYFRDTYKAPRTADGELVELISLDAMERDE